MSVIMPSKIFGFLLTALFLVGLSFVVVKFVEVILVAIWETLRWL